jgi:hypothetical protein
MTIFAPREIKMHSGIMLRLSYTFDITQRKTLSALSPARILFSLPDIIAIDIFTFDSMQHGR